MPKLITTADGSATLHSQQFDALYHSKHGAVQESQVVFIEAALHHQMEQHQTLSILEMGFGTGLNAFLTYLEAQRYALTIAYTGIEAYPIPLALAQELNYIKALEATPNDQAAFLQMHTYQDTRLSLSDRFSFCKQVQSFEHLDAIAEYDIIYYDAFAPAVQPQLWEEEAFQRAFQALRPGGVLTTYCAKGVVKRTLKAVGFVIEALPGPIGKREITRAIKPL